jgi:hypothetical protein
VRECVRCAHWASLARQLQRHFHELKFALEDPVNGNDVFHAERYPLLHRSLRTNMVVREAILDDGTSSSDTNVVRVVDRLRGLVFDARAQNSHIASFACVHRVPSHRTNGTTSGMHYLADVVVNICTTVWLHTSDIDSFRVVFPSSDGKCSVRMDVFYLERTYCARIQILLDVGWVF